MIFDCLDEPNAITSVLIKERGGKSVSIGVRERFEGAKGIGFKYEARGLKPKNAGDLWRLEKARKWCPP